MTSPSTPNSVEFLLKATQSLLLSAEQVHDLTMLVGASGASAADLAVRKGYLSVDDVEVVETLLRPGDAIPGYEILEVIGRGGMGVVYRAKQKNLDRVVALKTVSYRQMSRPDAVARFEQEAHTIARLHHPHIVTAYDFGKHEGRLYLAMEMVEGEDLEAFIHASGRLEEGVVWGLVRQAAWGLAHAASLEIVHRDIKPGNLMLVAPPAGFSLSPGLPMVKITDFGLALLSGGVDGRLTIEGTTLGSPHYMAPEQLRSSTVDLRADIYSLGATAYHMLAGQPPFPGQGVGEIVVAKLEGKTPPLSALAPRTSPEGVELVMAMMALSADDRPKDYFELLRRIDGAQATAAGNGETYSPSVSSTSSARKRRPRMTRRRPIALIVLLTMTLLAGAGALSWRLMPTSGEPGPPYTAGKWAAPLYDGQSLQGWTTIAGTWSPAEDREGGRVLAGAGSIRRRLPSKPKATGPLETFRLTVAVDIHEAKNVELQFGLTSGGYFALRLSPGEAELIKHEIAESGPGEGLARAPLATFGNAATADSQRYHELRVDRLPGKWVAYADDIRVGGVETGDEQALNEFRLLALNGLAWFDNPTITELVPAPVATVP